MRKFIAQLNDCSYINISADEMILEDNCIQVYCEGKLVAFLDVSVVLSAHLSEKAVKANEILQNR